MVQAGNHTLRTQDSSDPRHVSPGLVGLICVNITKHTASRTSISDLKWYGSDCNENLAVKAAVLNDYISSVYTVEPDGDFDCLRDSTLDSHRAMSELIITKDEIYRKLDGLQFIWRYTAI